MNNQSTNKRTIIDFIKSFNNTGFIGIETIWANVGGYNVKVGRKYHFEATKFAAAGIARTYNVEKNGVDIYYVITD